MLTHDELRKAAKKATGGLWEAQVYPDAHGIPDPAYTVESDEGNIAANLSEPDVRYIAAASPARVLALLDEIERLREALGNLADAADTVGIEFFDTDDLPGCVEKMRETTLTARAALRGTP